MEKDKKILATPKVRKFARELGANVSDIQGTERKGRITEYDVKKYITNQLGTESAKLHQKKSKVNLIILNLGKLKLKIYQELKK